MGCVVSGADSLRAGLYCVRRTDMKSSRAADAQTTGILLSFRDRFTASPQFAKLYREGMALVEETAEYLDRQGRFESKQLTPPASLAYTSESIKLTTRLTQLASWLLVRRAIAAGEIAPSEAHTHRHRVTLVPQSASHPDGFNALPETFRRLISESHRLYERILRLDRLMSEGYTEANANASTLGSQIEKIRHAFPAA
jgi:regulator of CtrA degradation